MKRITRKSDIEKPLLRSLAAYHDNGLVACVQEVNTGILCNKVKFPILEYCGTLLYKNIPIKNQLLLCDGIQKLKTEGGNVILGIILQKRLPTDFDGSFEKAVEYISDADIWYVCDIIGERVFGVALLGTPDKAIQKIRSLSKHQSNWVIRSLGAGIHYAIKKGLPSKHVSTLFKILLTMANTKDKEIRQGVGWAAKTTARFHPDVIEKHSDKINDTKNVANWFRRKIAVGLDRERYAKRN